MPGPRFPLYVLGKRMVSAYAYVPIAGGTRCSIGIFSYLNTMTFGHQRRLRRLPRRRRPLRRHPRRHRRAARPRQAAVAPPGSPRSRRSHPQEGGRGSGEPGRPGLTVAVTGPTGTFGSGLVPLLQDDDRIGRIIGIARRPFDPAERGWTKMEYRQGDVRDPDALREAFDGADVVVHLAFLITGNASRRDDAGDQRRRHAEHLPGGGRRRRAAVRLRLVGRRLRLRRRQPEPDRRGLADPPGRPAVLRAGEGGARGAAGSRRRPGTPSSRSTCCGRRSCSARTPSAGRTCCPDRWPRSAGGCSAGRGGCRSRCRCSCRSTRCSSSTRRTSAGRCCSASSAPGRPGAYNIAGDGVVTAADVAREFGALPIPLPAGPAQAAARACRPAAVPAAGRRVGGGGQPPGDHGHHARRASSSGWRPRYTGLEALRDTLRERPSAARSSAVSSSQARTSSASRSGTCSCGTWPTPASSR